jgi:membrane protease YdiL (CAAX protease family)
MEDALEPSDDRQSGFARRKRFRTLLELAVVLVIMTAPTLGSWGCDLLWDGEYQRYQYEERRAEFQSLLAYNVMSFHDIFLHLRYVPVILFLMWRSRDGWASFGFVRPRFFKDIAIAFALALAILVVDECLFSLRGARYGRSFDWSRLGPWPVPVDMELVLLARCFAIGFSEELVARSYLIPRLEGVTESSAWAVIISSVLFGLLHSYLSTLSVVLTGFSGILWGITFCKTRRIWPLALSHAIVDYVVFTHVFASIPK